jgi:hypothetical protein
VKLRFVRHARNRMRRDRISEADVRECIERADEALPSVNDRTNYLRQTPGGVLRVTAKAEGEEVIIITVTLMRKKTRP